ncbi:SURF1 family protein [Novosphingobium pentaromativorans]|uniref:SURF1-like protein n=1 Tax=Novosphingobium pentaromativorans US6-1 TaxID=1088721 RepID=G6E934_9SPHN|nr:SURF1 family protein [Novosphingobium pentaromativorans]AIT81145.1 surfeit locus 1 family protein [Novosphingobium pentaromativorans US6-1]EHJ62258.1 surfeit locus 1 family protein [Novosphingobium pentaromativorans US6-1]
MLTVGFAALGLWQIQRMHWKHALIARVDARVHAAPAALPGNAELIAKGSDGTEYLRVRASGTYIGRASALVRAATELGTGYWTMTPMRMDDGRLVWINRGFLPEGSKLAQVRKGVPQGRVSVIGLMREDEPGGSLLQSNRPGEERWYSRDIAALSRSRQLGPAAPVFIDAQSESGAGKAPGGLAPKPGLTVIHFPDNHLGYALTWFAMAFMSIAATVFVWTRKGGRQAC